VAGPSTLLRSQLVFKRNELRTDLFQPSCTLPGYLLRQNQLSTPRKFLDGPQSRIESQCGHKFGLPGEARVEREARVNSPPT
jgi:hypothetical protein